MLELHDLVRLATNSGARPIAEEPAGFDLESADWVATQIERAFGADLRYTLLRLRTNDRSANAQALSDNDIAATAICRRSSNPPRSGSVVRVIHRWLFT